MKVQMISILLGALVAALLLNLHPAHEHKDSHYIDNDAANVEWMNEQFDEIWSEKQD